MPRNSTTCDIYRAGNAPPANPDVPGVPCYLVYSYDLGRERGEKEQQCFRFVAMMYVATGTDIRDNFDYWTPPAAQNQDIVYVPDKNGIAYSVSFVERKQRGGANDQLVVYLDRMGVNWPWPGGVGQPGAILPPAPPTPPGGSLMMEQGPDTPISGLNTASTLTGAELTVLVQSGQDVQATLDAIAAFSASAATILTTQLQYPNNQPFGNSDNSLNYVDGSLFIDASGNLRFPGGSGVLATYNVLNYPGGDCLADSSGNLYYYSGGSMIAADAGGNLRLGTSGPTALYDGTNSAGVTGNMLIPSGGDESMWGFPQYANGGAMTDSGSNLYYSSGNVLADITGSIYYWTGQPLSDNAGQLFFSNGNVLANGGGNLFWNDGQVLCADGWLYYSTNEALADNSGNLWVNQALVDSTSSMGSTGQTPTSDGATMVWAYPQYANGQAMTDGSSDLLWSNGQIFLNSYGQINFFNGNPFCLIDGQLNYPNNSVWVDSALNTYLTNGNQFSDSSGNLHVLAMLLDNSGNYGSLGEYLGVGGGGNLQWQYLTYADGNPVTDASSNLYLDPGGTLFDTTGQSGDTGMYLGGNGGNAVFAYLQYSNGNPLTDAYQNVYYPNPTAQLFIDNSGQLYYIRGNLLTDTSNSLHLDTSGGDFVDSNGVSGSDAGPGTVLAINYDPPNTAIWQFPIYADGQVLTDSGSNLYLNASGGDFYDSQNVSATAAGPGTVLAPGYGAGGPTAKWQLPIYCDGNAIIDNMGNLYLDPGSGLCDSTSSFGSPGQVLTINGSGLPQWT